YQTVGPRVEHKVVAYGEIETIKDLPQGFASEQEKGRYRLVKNEGDQYFDALPGSQNWKKYLYPPRKDLFFLEKTNRHWEKSSAPPTEERHALVGVRACELAGIEILDKVFIRKDFTDPDYSRSRSNLFIVSVNCSHPDQTCFCSSMGTGPECQGGYDLNLTELDEAFIVNIGSDAGLAVIQQVEWEPASAYHLQSAQKVVEGAKQSLKRGIKDLEDVPALLLDHLEHPLWAEVGKRCLSCGSCTLVCPTCFCWDTNDHVYITTKKTNRERVWDSCFNPGYSAQAGGNTRPSTKSRYRQWLTHKFGNWKDQFGSLGCVGCGRCITWCPAGIDVTEEIGAFQEEFVS
ncbi:MAG: 4Fe-4S dicluster domain-containing protein, partial [Chloroflexota bacterium]